ncbi:helix-turn-helix domain-containing protein [Mediterranea massiliensis]|uniref:helix-turn-helix domain-containing protein n=1 Tax=Mediterranea massiliensis TaxID=1841865 RepID=UPI0025A3C4DB|nr:helix-turn-helix transcriptional regulator [Mediterranea massiliensis]MDM8337780.1 helix-turn-helix transcriptional regulator [Mediterranea massiliensis]
MKPSQILYIKNMVCNRCIMVVRAQLLALGLHPLSVELGRVELAEAVDDSLMQSIRQTLEPLGFELIDDRRSLLTEQIKAAVIELVHYSDQQPKTNLSDYLATRLNHDYSALSKLFSETTGTTIEKYFIAQKTERAKELLIYGELSIGEIADLLNYSSTAYFSSQFKSQTGLTPGQFRQLRENRRKPLDQV